jgi:hypothetical protein
VERPDDDTRPVIAALEDGRENAREGSLSARSALLDRQLGALKPGYKADMVLLDMRDTAYLPYNSAARQLVYTETGRGIASVIIDGRVVVKDRVVQTIDESALRAEVYEHMKRFVPEFEGIVKAREKALPYLLEAHKQVWGTNLKMHRFLNRTGYGMSDLPQ